MICKGASRSDAPGKAKSAVAGCASRTEGRAIGFALGACLFVLYADFRCTAMTVDGVVFAVCYVATHAGVCIALFLAHGFYLLIVVAILVSASWAILFF